MTSIGWATLSVIPSFDGFRRNVETGTSRAMEAAGKSGGDKFGAAASKAMADEGAAAGEKFGTEAAEAGGDSFSSKIGDGVKKGALAAGAIAGVALGAGIVGALERGALSDKLAAQLGVGEKKSAQLGAVAGDLYSNAYGDSLEGVNGALRAVVTNLDGFRNASKKKLTDVTATVLDLNAAFDEEPDAIARAATQMVRTDLAKNSREALNIITRGFQTGADKSQDLLDTFNEYGTQFRKLGLSGRKATGLLSQGLQGGARDADLVADALKEFTLRTTESLVKTTNTVDGPKASLTALGEAFKAAGFDALDADPKIAKLADRLQSDIAGGGDKATAGLQSLLDGLRKTDDPLERSRNAVALFGTQAEDLGDALLSLDPSKAEKDLGRVGGAAKRMGNTLSDNAATKIESFKRTIQTNLVDFIGNEFIPFFEDDIQPALEDFADWFKRDGADALRDFGDDVKSVTGKVEALVGFLNDLPKPAKVAGILALVGGVGAAKLTGGGGGALGTAGKVLGIAKPVPVFVTNKGFGDGVGMAGKSSFLGSLATTLGPLLVPAAALVVPKVIPEEDLPNSAGGGNSGGMTLPKSFKLFDEDENYQNYLKAIGQGGEVAKGLDGLISKAGLFGDELDLVGKKKVDPSLTIRGMDKARGDLQKFLGQQIEARKPITPYVTLTGYDRALAQIETLTAKIHSIPSAGVDNGVTYASGGGTSAGVAFNGPITVKANDPREFAAEVNKRTRDRAMGGRG